jgi:hypothetical protein
MSAPWSWEQALQRRPAEHPHELMAERLNQLFAAKDDGPQAMARLLDEFPAAGIHDWGSAFAMQCSPLHGGPGLLVQYLVEIFERYPDLTVNELIEAVLLARARRCP